MSSNSPKSVAHADCRHRCHGRFACPRRVCSQASVSADRSKPCGRRWVVSRHSRVAVERGRTVPWRRRAREVCAVSSRSSSSGLRFIHRRQQYASGEVATAAAAAATAAVATADRTTIACVKSTLLLLPPPSSLRGSAAAREPSSSGGSSIGCDCRRNLGDGVQSERGPCEPSPSDRQTISQRPARHRCGSRPTAVE